MKTLLVDNHRHLFHFNLKGDVQEPGKFDAALQEQTLIQCNVEPSVFWTANNFKAAIKNLNARLTR